jgi:hypothetical protein
MDGDAQRHVRLTPSSIFKTGITALPKGESPKQDLAL